MLARGEVPKDAGAGLFKYQIKPSGSTEIRPVDTTLPTALVEALSNSAKGFQEIASLYAFSIAHTHGAPQLTVGLGLDGSIAREREQFIVQTLWVAVAPNLIQTEVRNLDFVALRGKIAAQVEQKGTKIYQR